MANFRNYLEKRLNKKEIQEIGQQVDAEFTVLKEPKENVSLTLTHLPDDIENTFEQDFQFSKKIIFCQMATQSKNHPHVRTVRLYGMKKDEGLIFVTRNTSKKWHELKDNPSMAVCFLNPEYQIQLRAECKVTLLNYTLAPRLVEKYWRMVREDVKKIYHEHYTPDVPYQELKWLSVPEKIPDCFGLIVAAPYSWEYLFVDSDYPNSIRYVYTKNPNGKWIKERLTIA